MTEFARGYKAELVLEVHQLLAQSVGLCCLGGEVILQVGVSSFLQELALFVRGPVEVLRQRCPEVLLR